MSRSASRERGGTGSRSACDATAERSPSVPDTSRDHPGGRPEAGSDRDRRSRTGEGTGTHTCQDADDVGSRAGPASLDRVSARLAATHALSGRSGRFVARLRSPVRTRMRSSRNGVTARPRTPSRVASARAWARAPRRSPAASRLPRGRDCRPACLSPSVIRGVPSSHSKPRRSPSMRIGSSKLGERLRAH
jgi:hypothetical protein